MPCATCRLGPSTMRGAGLGPNIGIHWPSVSLQQDIMYLDMCQPAAGHHVLRHVSVILSLCVVVWCCVLYVERSTFQQRSCRVCSRCRQARCRVVQVSPISFSFAFVADLDRLLFQSKLTSVCCRRRRRRRRCKVQTKSRSWCQLERVVRHLPWSTVLVGRAPPP